LTAQYADGICVDGQPQTEGIGAAFVNTWGQGSGVFTVYEGPYDPSSYTNQIVTYYGSLTSMLSSWMCQQ
jgi:hypothetical protein